MPQRCDRKQCLQQYCLEPCCICVRIPVLQGKQSGSQLLDTDGCWECSWFVLSEQMKPRKWCGRRHLGPPQRPPTAGHNCGSLKPWTASNLGKPKACRHDQGASCTILCTVPHIRGTRLSCLATIMFDTCKWVYGYPRATCSRCKPWACHIPLFHSPRCTCRHCIL
jgi:hypothetical protein